MRRACFNSYSLKLLAEKRNAERWDCFASGRIETRGASRNKEKSPEGKPADGFCLYSIAPITFPTLNG